MIRKIVFLFLIQFSFADETNTVDRLEALLQSKGAYISNPLKKDINLHVFVFSKRHKKDKLISEEIRKGPVRLIKKLKSYGVKNFTFYQVLKVKGLPKFVPMRMIKKKLRKKAKQFDQMMRSHFSSEEIEYYDHLPRMWYMDRRSSYFRDLEIAKDSQLSFVFYFPKIKEIHSFYHADQKDDQFQQFVKKLFSPKK
ncbi:hypothetical protein MJH12_16165 [bacterium]|nr:hypothetical protein [bacterium]